MFNEVNARRINDEVNMFDGLHRSPIFLGVIAVTVGLQAIIMQTRMGMFFKVIPLNGAEWGVSIAIGASSIPISVLTRLLGGMMPTVRRRRNRRTLSSTARLTGSRMHNEAVAIAMARRASIQREKASGTGAAEAHHHSPRAVAAVAGGGVGVAWGE